jgi:hypothetical protein
LITPPLHKTASTGLSRCRNALVPGSHGAPRPLWGSSQHGGS